MKTALSAALALFLPAVVAAQSASISPSFAASEVYDGNLFATPDHEQQTLVHRFGPRLELDARSAPLFLIGRYALDVDFVQALPDQGLQISRQLASLALRYQPMERLTLEGDGYYIETRTLVALTATPIPAASGIPSMAPALSTLTALDRGRLRATRLSAGPAFDYRIDRRVRADASYSFTHDHLLDLRTDAHIGKAGLSYLFTRTDTGSTTLLVRKFVLDQGSLAASQVVLFGWSHRLARRTLASAHAGPRFRHGDVDGVEGDASVRHGFGRTELELTYSREETITLGLPGVREIDQVALSAGVQIKPVLFRANSGFARTHGVGLQADLEYVQFIATTPVDPWLSIELSASLSWQQLKLQTSTMAGAIAGIAGNGEIFHDLIAVTLVVAPPKPLEW